MFCHRYVDQASISVMPLEQPVGWVKIVVKTSGSPVVVAVDEEVPLATAVVVDGNDDDDEGNAAEEGEAVVDVLVACPPITLMVCRPSWPDARGTASKTNCQAEGNMLSFQLSQTCRLRQRGKIPRTRYYEGQHRKTRQKSYDKTCPTGVNKTASNTEYVGYKRTSRATSESGMANGSRVAS